MSKETDETMPKKEFQGVQLQAVQNNGGMRLALNSFAELEKFSHFMSISKFVPKHLRGQQADCLAVLLQSMRWEMDPFTVAQKTYFVNDGMGYEAQLVNAIIISRAPIKNRPKFEWTGEGEALKCKVSATFKGEDTPSEFEAELKTISTRNSPLWKQQPKQQLSYFALRAWARIYAPDVIMGVYTKEEVESIPSHIGAENALNITPSKSTVSDLNAEFINAHPARTDPLNASIDEALAEREQPETASLSDRVYSMIAEIHMDRECVGTADFQDIANSDGFKAIWAEIKKSGDKELLGAISEAVA